MATDPTPDKPARKRSTDPTPDAPAKARKKPWEMTPSEIDERCTEAIRNRHNELDGEPKRFKRGEGVREIEDDSALGATPPDRSGRR